MMAPRQEIDMPKDTVKSDEKRINDANKSGKSADEKLRDLIK